MIPWHLSISAITGVGGAEQGSLSIKNMPRPHLLLLILETIILEQCSLTHFCAGNETLYGDQQFIDSMSWDMKTAYLIGTSNSTSIPHIPSRCISFM